MECCPWWATLLARRAISAPVAIGALSRSSNAHHGVTGLNVFLLTRIISALLTPFCVLVPFWLIWAFAGFRRMMEIWPAILITGVTFATTQLVVARRYGPCLAAITPPVVPIPVLVLFLRVSSP